jgi:hypothetical protein
MTLGFYLDKVREKMATVVANGTLVVQLVATLIFDTTTCTTTTTTTTTTNKETSTPLLLGTSRIDIRKSRVGLLMRFSWLSVVRPVK